MYFINYIIVTFFFFLNKRALSRLRWLKYVAFFSLLNKLVGGLHLAYFQYVQHPNATPLTAQNIKIKLPFVQKKCLGRESTSSVVCPYNSIYFTWTETINCLRLYKHKIEHNTLGLSKVSVPPLPPSSPLSISSQVHPFVCRQSLFSKQGGKKIHVPDKYGPRWIIQIALELADGFEYMKLQGNVQIWLDSGRV